MDRLAEILAESIRPKGTRDLDFREMLEVLEGGQAQGLTLFSVDVTTVGQVRPLPEWMFRLTDEEEATVPKHQIIPMALDFYRSHATNADLAGAWFQVFLYRPE